MTQQRWWGGPLDVEQFARSAVLRVRDAVAEIAAARGLPVQVSTSEALIAASFDAIRHLRIDGRAPHPWGEFSGFFSARDGWLRLHGNYPHHAAVLREVLGIEDRTGLERAIARRAAVDVEEQVGAAGGIAVAVRTEQQWQQHPHAVATAQDPWSQVEDRGERPTLGPLPARRDRDADELARPLAGVRVLDLTRVIAGPSATQLLACLGAEVLRLDPPHRPEILDQHLSTGMGKRSALLDLREDAGAERMRHLAAQADVILDGYRPGALGALGLGTSDLAQLAPQAVLVSLSAWGEHGPWGQRAGFDSIVQAATGIADRCREGDRPGALAVQALDHASGQRIAAHVIESLAQARAATIRVNLLGAARALLAMPSPSEDPGSPQPPALQVAASAGSAGPDGGSELNRVPLVSVPSADGALMAVPPPLLLDGASIELPVGAYGASPTRFS